MDQSSFGHLRGNVKALSAALGVGVLITMGALTLTSQTSSVGTRSDIAKTDTVITMTAPPMSPSVAPTLKASYCDNDSPHAWLDGCAWNWAPK
jgi:hypothetical protein